MKLIYALLLLTVLGCTREPQISKLEIDETNSNTDSVIAQSERHLVDAYEAIEGSDSTIERKVTNTVKQITTLKKEVKQLKEENNVLKLVVSKYQTAKPTPAPATVVDSVDDDSQNYRLRAISDN